MQYTKTIPDNREYDILVVGGGPAGCAAAAAAAREGKRVLLVESEGCLGGMGTAGLVPAWAPFSDGQQVIYRGLALKVFTEAGQGLTPPRGDSQYNWVAIDSESLKRVYDRLMQETGVDVLFHSTLCDVGLYGDRIGYAVISNKQGLTAYHAKVFVDATGDADLAYRSGGETVYGGEKGEIQPASLCFTLSNVDSVTYPTEGNMHPSSSVTKAYDMMADPAFPLIADKHICLSWLGEGVVGFNAGHLFDVDSTDPVSVGRAEMLGRELAKQERDALAKHCPSVYGKARLTSTAAKLGVRESRRIVGDYVLCRDDYIARATFPDEIGRNCYYLDTHGNKEEEKLPKDHSLELRYKAGESHGIPYRCLIPKGVSNLLVAGRCLSADRAVQGSIRVMPTCLVTGEAAGAAAALSLLCDGDVRQVDVPRLRDLLRSHGAYFL